MKEAACNLFVDLRVLLFSLVHSLVTWWHREELDLLECYANGYASRWFETEAFQMTPVQHRINAIIWGLGWDFCKYKTGEEIAGLAIALQIVTSNVDHQTRKYAPVIRVLRERPSTRNCVNYLESVLEGHLKFVDGEVWVESGVVRAWKTFWYRRTIRQLEEAATAAMSKHVDAACERCEVPPESRCYIERSHWTHLRGVIVSLGYAVMEEGAERLAQRAADLNYTLYYEGERFDNPISRNSFPIQKIVGGAIHVAYESRVVAGDLRKTENGNL